jgi:hypothetical protein
MKPTETVQYSRVHKVTKLIKYEQFIIRQHDIQYYPVHFTLHVIVHFGVSSTSAALEGLRPVSSVSVNKTPVDY